MKKILYKNKTIAYTVCKAKVKNLYISIQNGEVVIKAPWYTTSTQIQEIVESKREWITKKLQEYQTSPRKTKDYADGETFQVLGEKYILNIYYKDQLSCTNPESSTTWAGGSDSTPDHGCTPAECWLRPHSDCFSAQS